MHDLVGAYERLNSVYRKYIESAFPLRYANLAEERRALYAASDILSQPPLVEPTPVYPSSGLTLAQAATQLPPEYRDLPHLAQGLLENSGLTLWKHQWDSVKAVLQDKRDLVVTTGTGSGKTECFLLPVLAELARESLSWPKCPEAPDGRKWWEDDAAGWQSQWGHTTRHAEGQHAIRAMVLYPLNALVEDQLRRVRQALDSEAVHKWLDAERGGNRITFGRYTGATPIAGTPESAGSVNRLRQRLLHMAGESAAVRADSDLSSNVRYHFPNLDGGEMWSRWDMQHTPPDIIITNYHMLNIMLMRQAEASLFSQTKAWLDSDPSNRFFLIVDELHSYRGTPGTEVAYILRLLLDRIGLSPESEQLVLLATSASVTDTDQSRKFLKGFFGRDNFQIIAENQEMPDIGSHKLMHQFQPAFEAFARKIQPSPLSPMAPPLLTNEVSEQAMLELASALGGHPQTGAEPAHELSRALLNVKANHALRDACRIVGKGEIRAAKLSELDRLLFGTDHSSNSASDPMRGLLLALGSSRREGDETSPQPVRGHFFFHTVQNMWVCANPDCDEDLHRETLDEGSFTSDALGPVGALQAQHRITCTCGGRVLDLLICEVCGDILLGGYRGKLEGGGDVLTADMPNIAALPNLISDNRKYREYAVFWPLGRNEPNAEPEDAEFTYNKVERRWHRSTLNVRTGVLFRTSAAQRPDEIGGWVYSIGGPSADEQEALPPKCPRCDADYRRRQYDTPLRVHRTGFQKACQVIAGALAREMPLQQLNKPARKLLIFTDSRQDAAKLASGMERDHYRDMVRVLLLQSLDEYWASFVAAVKTVLERVPQSVDQIAELNPALLKAVSIPPSPDDARLSTQFQSLSGGLFQELLSWAVGLPTANPATLNTLMGLIQDYPGRVPLRAIRDRVKLEFLRLGFNPGGNGYPQNHYSTGSDRNEEVHYWTELYDWSLQPPQLRNGLLPQAEQLNNRIDSTLMAELVYTLFQHAIRTLESLGTGWVTYVPYQEPPDEVIGAVETAIRLLGIRWRHQYTDRFYPGTETKFPKYIEKYLEDAEVPVEAVKAQFTGAGIEIGGDAYLGINPDNLYVVKKAEVDSDRNKGWQCPKCAAFFLHPTGYRSVCPNCKGVRLVEGAYQKNFDYYVYLAEEGGPPFRLRCEELTGQTDEDDRPRRQRWFQEVFVADEQELKLVQGVDLLSVTTTMEAGVDIGGLEAVMMANMPPRRFNYQQRVGRAGRRGAGVSLAVTFCRGRSHDDFYYHRPEQITGDPPPQPYVDVSSSTIFKRVFVKEVLRLAFNDLGEQGENLFQESVHGEFGSIQDWHGRRDKLSRWLNEANNEPTIASVLDALRVGTSWAGHEGTTLVRDMLTYIRGELVNAISVVADDASYPQNALSERLAHAGLLPMFGFPTDSRPLYTDAPRFAHPWPPQRGVVTRDMSIAISQFAPGSQIVKDKAIYTACGIADFYPRANRVHTRSGLTPPLQTENVTFLGICQSCQSVQFSEENRHDQPCQVCNKAEVEFLDAREPKGFFTDFMPQDYHGIFEWTPRSTIPTLAFQSEEYDSIDVANCSLYRFTDDIISVNDNDHNGGFEFQRARIANRREWADAYAVDPGPGRNGQVSVSGEPRTIALLARRKTDVLLVGLQQWPMGVFANPLTAVGRAAWYSFAFFLRNAAATLMDVDTLEFNAGSRPTRDANGHVVGQAFLSDTLQNGAGYCWWLGQAENFQTLLNQGDIAKSGSSAELWHGAPHGHECDTSCNRCLRDFYNLPYHGLLDWRLAAEMARLAVDPSVSPDLTSPWNGRENLWQSLCEGSTAPIPAVLTNLGYRDGSTLNGLSVYANNPLKSVCIVRHPLWTDDHPIYIAARSEAGTLFRDYRIVPVNPFEVIRHPAGVFALGR